MTTRRTSIAAALACALALACSHTRRVGEPRPEEAADAPAKEKVEKGKSGEATRTRVPPRDGRPAVSASPAGLMNEGSARKIQDALRARGLLEGGSSSGELDDATSAALRRFQKTEGLAQTGAPDRETLRKLGIDPNDVYRSVPEGEEAVKK